MDYKYPFADMEIGDAVIVPKDQYTNARASSDYYWRRHQMKFSWARMITGQYQCTRIEPTKRGRVPNPVAAQFKAMKVGDSFTVSEQAYTRAQSLGSYYAARLKIVLRWRCWPSGRHECTRLK